MSIKIYNGIKFKSNNINEVIDQLITLRKSALEINLSNIPYYINIFYNSLKEKPDDSLKFANLFLGTFSKYYRKYSDPMFRFGVYIYFYKNEIHGYYYDETNRCKKLLNNISDDFHYQNQTDCPDYISENEWKFRKDAWEEMLPTGFLKEKGLKFSIIDEDDINIFFIEECFNKIKNNKEK